MCGAAAGNDVVQETFLAVLKARGFDERKGSAARYLFGIARHHIIRHLASHRATLMETPEAAHDVAASQSSAFDTMVREQMVAAVRTAVESLPNVYREVVVLCDLEEMDTRPWRR